MGIAAIRRDLRKLGSPRKARELQRFFKTGPGEYGEGDVFLGVRVPELRALVRRYADLPLDRVPALLGSRIHEERLFALLLLVRQFSRGDQAVRTAVYELYMARTAAVNNWDLVDLSAAKIVGAHLEDRDRSRLDTLTGSGSLWERRIAIVATLHFIRQGDLADTFRIADRLLGDPEDLIHKAVGWMLREAGKRDRAAEEAFLRPRYASMPRTMLRYAIERFPEPLRQDYLKGRV